MNSPFAKVVQDWHEVLVWLIPQLDQFPKSRRFTLGERLESRVLLILEDLVEAAYGKDKKTPLTRANRQLEIMRHLWRSAFELKVISLRQYEQGIKRMDNVGRQIGGWLRLRAEPEAPE